MPRFFVQSTQIADGIVTVLGDDAHHISRALRMAAGEQITVCDMQHREYICELTEFLPDRVLCRVLSVTQSVAEPPVFITLYQALPKGDKLDAIIQKAVECGACRIVPFESERCVMKSKPETEERKIERRVRIALEAAKQSGRGILPEVLPTVSFECMLREASCADTVLFCYEGDETTPVGELLRAKPPKDGTLAIVIGSEGGFSLSEAQRAREAGCLMCGLGPRILRTETASSFVLGAISCLVELGGLC